MAKINTDCKSRTWKIKVNFYKLHKPWRSSFTRTFLVRTRNSPFYEKTLVPRRTHYTNYTDSPGFKTSSLLCCLSTTCRQYFKCYKTLNSSEVYVLQENLISPWIQPIWDRELTDFYHSMLLTFSVMFLSRVAFSADCQLLLRVILSYRTGKNSFILSDTGFIIKLLQTCITKGRMV